MSAGKSAAARGNRQGRARVSPVACLAGLACVTVQCKLSICLQTWLSCFLAAVCVPQHGACARSWCIFGKKVVWMAGDVRCLPRMIGLRMGAEALGSLSRFELFVIRGYPATSCTLCHRFT